MTLMQLVYFCEVAKTRQFTAAANNLYVAQSSLSHAIHELENELGVPLFIRYPNKSISLSDYGQAFLPFVENALNVLDTGKYEIESMKNPQFGKVKISFFFSIALTTVPYLIKQFHADNPDNHIKLDFQVNHNWVDLRDSLLRGNCDLVISCNNLTSNVESKPFAYQKIVLIVPVDHKLAEQEFVTVKELENENIIAIDPNSNLDNAMKRMFSDAGITPNLTYVSDWTTSEIHISAGEGIGFSSDIPVDERYLKKLPISDTEAIMPMYLSWPTNRKLSQATTFYRDYLLNYSVEKGMHSLIF